MKNRVVRDAVYYSDRENLTALSVSTHSPLVLVVKVG
jgi:hypothetical protein